ncbi:MULTISPECIES: hypothetical protein [unclassified Sphingomonas]|uniref:hypothetical protein n=1 Tax=unclassified Sphingomonas TaxID=196159 RepID=UPI00226A0684|nr:MULTISPECIES: hypothetical protein [unclassified Sphingomonas]
MVSIQDAVVNDALTLAEFIEHVETKVDVDDYDSVVENAWALRALANDRDFVLRGYHEELKRHWQAEAANVQSSQTTRLGAGKGFYVRSNVWLPIAEGAHAAFERQLYSYDLAHDHNFDFVTVGYFGSGYDTDLYSYDYDAVDGFVGEHVDLEDHGTHKLHPGRVMVYRGGRDIHVQRTPPDVSVSLNLLCTSRRMHKTQQYLFDVTNRTIVNGAGDLCSMRMFVLEILRHVNDQNTIDVLSNFAEKHPSDRSRAYALNVLRDLDADEADRLSCRLPTDVVRLSAKTLVNGAGSRDYSRTAA